MPECHARPLPPLLVHIQPYSGWRITPPPSASSAMTCLPELPALLLEQPVLATSSPALPDPPTHQLNRMPLCLLRQRSGLLVQLLLPHAELVFHLHLAAALLLQSILCRCAHSSGRVGVGVCGCISDCVWTPDIATPESQEQLSCSLRGCLALRLQNKQRIEPQPYCTGAACEKPPVLPVSCLPSSSWPPMLPNNPHGALRICVTSATLRISP